MRRWSVVGGRLSVVAALVAAAFVSCRTARPVGKPIAALTATTAAEAREELFERREQFRGARSLMRVRATANGKTESFRALLVVHDEHRMELVAYTPVGTAALTVKANDNRVSVHNHLDGTNWEGTADRLPEPFKFLGNEMPANVALVVLGYPFVFDSSWLGYNHEVDVTGLREFTAPSFTATFEPPAFPAKHVVITRGNDRVEIEHLEVVED